MAIVPRARRHLALAVALLATAGAFIGVPTPVAAAPGTDSEGGTQALRDALDAASRGYVDAKAKLAGSTRRQGELTLRLRKVEDELAVRTATIGELAGVAYRTGRVGYVSALLDSGSAGTFIDRASSLNVLAAQEDKQVRELVETRDRVAVAKAAIEAEMREQRKQLAVMAVRKTQAERALSAVGGQRSAGYSGTNSSLARPAPRNPDGSWPPESCSVNDPTTSGCITPRTLHALNQAKAAGFTRYVSCYRSGGSGEHPKGRACDFAAQKGGFGGVATGGDRTYGNNLAAYFVRNADRLGVLYVIWFRQIWLPSSGWRSYNGGGNPSSDHTNHVHLSVH